MPDIFYLISKWWKQMLLLIGISLLVVGGVVFFQPFRFLSVATALPASSLLTDKAGVFNSNIQELYSSIGEPDNLDRIIGTSRLDTVYLAVATAFNLWDHYKVEEQGQAAVRKAAIILEKYSKVVKSDYGELKVKVWDTDKDLAPQLANAILDQLNTIHQELQNQSNRQMLKGLKEGMSKLVSSKDSTGFTNREEQVREYGKLINQYQLIIDTRPSVLLVVEKARAAERPDTPKRELILTATAVLAFLFSLLVALLLERKKIKSD